MLQPEEIEIEGKKFMMSKFPATVGREIILQYPTSALPKLGDYSTNESLMLKIMSYVGVVIDGRTEPLMLNSRQLVDNHVTTAEMLLKLEWAMMSYNFSFFGQGKLSGILDRVTTQVGQLIRQTLTAYSHASSGKDGQP